MMRAPSSLSSSLNCLLLTLSSIVFSLSMCACVRIIPAVTLCQNSQHKIKTWIHLLSQSVPKCLFKMQAKFYLSIIDDVIESIRELFLDEGLEDRLVDDLRHVSYVSPNKIVHPGPAEQNQSSSSDVSYQGVRQPCLLICSSGNQRWCSQKQWKTWGRATSTHPTLCCSFLLTTDRPIRRSPVTLLPEIKRFCQVVWRISVHIRRRCLNWIIFSIRLCSESEMFFLLILCVYLFFPSVSASVVIPSSQNIHSFPRIKASASQYIYFQVSVLIWI